MTGIAGAGVSEGLDPFACSAELEKRSGVPMPDQVRRLKDLPIRHKAECEIEGMGEAVLREFDR